MNSMTKSSAMLAGALLLGGAWSGAFAQNTPTPGGMPVEGTVYSTHSPAKDGCPALDWHVAVGPNRTLSGMVATDNMKDVWRMNGSLLPDRKFHLDGHEVGGAQRTGTVDGQVQPNGALVMTLGNITGSSPCNNKTIYVRWFRNGNNAYDPNEAQGGEGG